MGIKTFTCPSRGEVVSEHPALSRKDNTTEICSECGTLEALEGLINNQQGVD